MASVFSQIIAGDIPGHFVWQDEFCVAFMTIAPIREGHVLVVPRNEVDHWHDLPDALALHLMSISKKIAKAVQAAYPAKRVGMMIAGLEVPHTHIHLMPIDTMADMDFARATMTDPALLKVAASNISAKL
jgi:histidine triad (HIT) family protein|tara:strand:+ start:756 stop:1145 length:390 start_codon:yes stop_codon:yes gene_type:complete